MGKGCSMCFQKSKSFQKALHVILRASNSEILPLLRFCSVFDRLFAIHQETQNAVKKCQLVTFKKSQSHPNVTYAECWMHMKKIH